MSTLNIGHLAVTAFEQLPKVGDSQKARMAVFRISEIQYFVALARDGWVVWVGSLTELTDKVTA